jgi:NADH-quinone oxidoreductase subunit A
MSYDKINIILMLENSIVKKDYLSLFLFLLFAVILSIIIMVASYFLVRQNPESEKLSAYECGFEPYEDSRQVFDIRFSVVAIMFIVFDIEIMFLMPWCSTLSKIDLLSFWSMIDFLIELGVGFFYVWYSQSLDWK